MASKSRLSTAEHMPRQSSEVTLFERCTVLLRLLYGDCTTSDFWLVGRPVRVGGKQTIHEADLEHDKQPKGDTDQAGGNRQEPVEGAKSLTGIGEGRPNDDGDHHHACDCSNPEHQ